MENLLQGIMYDENQENGQGDEQKPNPQENNSPFRSFESEDDYKKELQSTSSKAKGELLKEFGVNSVSDYKEKMKGYKEYKASQSTDLEKAQASATDLETKYNEQVIKNETLDNKMKAIEHGAKIDAIPDVLALANIKVKDGKDIDTAIMEVLKQYSQFKSLNGVSFGKEDQVNEEKIKPTRLGSKKF